MYLKLAWRNLWRNRGRTIITMMAVFFAVILSTAMMSLKEGVYDNMIEGSIGAFTGYAQVHARGYWDDKTLDNGMTVTDTVTDAIAAIKGIRGYVPRIESFALAASDELTKGSTVIGADPEREALFSNLDERVTEGEYFEPDDQAVLIGSGLADYLKVGVGDTLVLLGQGYHGVSAAGKYPIKGKVKFGSPELSKQLVFLPMKEAQWLYATEGTVTNLVLLLDNPEKAMKISAELAATLGDRYEVMDWETLAPTLKNMIENDRVEGYVFMFILYLVISFGMFGTMLMMLAERKHEFGVLVAVGMKRRRLAAVVWLEVMIISLLGAIFGMGGAFPVCAYFHYNPIRFGDEMGEIYEQYGMEAVLQASIDPGIFIQQATVVAIIASVIAIYPLIKIMRMDAIKAMRS